MIPEKCLIATEPQEEKKCLLRLISQSSFSSSSICVRSRLEESADSEAAQIQIPEGIRSRKNTQTLHVAPQGFVSQTYCRTALTSDSKALHGNPFLRSPYVPLKAKLPHVHFLSSSYTCVLLCVNTTLWSCIIRSGQCN